MYKPDKNGGPAYPIHDAGSWDGMSLRDRFAIAALPVVGFNDGHSDELGRRARAAYKQADAMLEARKQ